MRIIHTLILFSAVILDSIEWSSEFDCLPDGNPFSDDCEGESSARRNSPARENSPARKNFAVGEAPSTRQNHPDEPSLPERQSPDREHPLARQNFLLEHLSARHNPLARQQSVSRGRSPGRENNTDRENPPAKQQSLLRGHPPTRQHLPVTSQSPGSSLFPSEHPRLPRSRSPARERSPLCILGAKLTIEELEFIRLVPFKNMRQRFRIHKYTFSSNEPLHVLGKGKNRVQSMPVGEQNVLTTTTGDVVAILERNNTILRGIYDSCGRRVRINMESGNIVELNPDLASETPLASASPLSRNFYLLRLGHA